LQKARAGELGMITRPSIREGLFRKQSMKDLFIFKLPVKLGPLLSRAVKPEYVDYSCKCE